MVRMSWSMYKAQRTTLWSRPFPSTFRWDPGVKIRLPDLYVGEAFSFLSQPPYHLCQPKLPRPSDLAVWTGHHHDVFTSAPEDFFRAALSDFLKLLRLDRSGCSLSQVTLLFSLSRSTPLSPVLIVSLPCFGNIPTPQTRQPEQANSEIRSR